MRYSRKEKKQPSISLREGGRGREKHSSSPLEEKKGGRNHKRKDVLCRLGKGKMKGKKELRAFLIAYEGGGRVKRKGS